MDRLSCMQVFVRVVEQGAFARAADSLGISRASATTAVSRLERRLGVRLLHRTTRRLTLTDDGRNYYADCVRILDEVAEAEDGLSRSCASPRGRLRVSVPQSFVSTIFFPALADFMDRHEELSVEIVLTDRAVNLVEEGIDCAIRGVEIPGDSELVARQLSETRWLTCASPDYLAAHGTPTGIAELEAHRCIRFISPSSGRSRPWVFMQAGVEQGFEPEGPLRMTSMEAAVEAASAGLGIVQVPDALAFRAVESGTLLPLLVDLITPAPPLVLVYPGNRYLPAKVRAFAEYFSRVFPREGWWPRILALLATRTPSAA